MVNAELDSAQVTFPPPLLFLIFLLLGGALHYFYPLPLMRGLLQTLLAIVFSFTALITVIICFFEFSEAKTHIEPWRKTTTLITHGPFHLSRNPLYLSAILLGIGLGFAFNSAWLIIMMAPFALLIR